MQIVSCDLNIMNRIAIRSQYVLSKQQAREQRLNEGEVSGK